MCAVRLVGAHIAHTKKGRGEKKVYILRLVQRYSSDKTYNMYHTGCGWHFVPGSHHLECVVSGGVNTFDVLSSMDALLGRALIA